MALYISPDTWEKAQATCSILRSEAKDGITNYVIEMRVSSYKWLVMRRYRQFVELHEKMTKNFSINKNLLPPKKIIGNRSESFITERQKGLELYLQTLLYRLTSLPDPLAIFLDFQKYEIRAITSILSEMLFNEGDGIVANGHPYEFNPLQLHAITERLKLEDPPFYSSNPKQDISHLVEFITKLKHLKIVGSFECFESSNIIPNCLSFDLSLFKFLQTIEILDCKLEKHLTSVEALRARLTTITIQKSITNLSTFLLCDILHWCPAMDPVQNGPFWQAVTYANFSHNSLTKIHPCIKLLASVQKIDFSYNGIELIENLETLSKLSILELSNNKIQNLHHLHTRLGNIQSLNLSSNRIERILGLSKLFSVTELYLESNLISSMAEIRFLSKLPCLGILNLHNNPVTFTVDYRSQLLLMLEHLAPEVTIDGVKASEKEIDTVSILQALRDARTEPISNLTHNDQLKVTNSRSALSVNSIRESSRKRQDRSSRGECAAKRKPTNSHNKSGFREQIETLRRTGGADWLRMLNDMDPNKDTDRTTGKGSTSGHTLKDMQIHTVHPLDHNSNMFTTERIKKYSVSYEMCYPGCLAQFDCENQKFKQKLFATTLRGKILSDEREISSKTISEVQVFWVFMYQNNVSSQCEVPICLLLLQTEIIFLELNTVVYELHERNYFSNVITDLVFVRSFKPDDVLSLSIGPCNAYIELKVKSQGRSENITILTVDEDATNMFVKESLRLYNIDSTCKPNPFANHILDIEKFDFNLSGSKFAVEKQIIFIQRVCLSKAFHKSQSGILHYILVTPSHIVLMEERLHYPQIVELDLTLKHDFQVCAIVSVHTNIKQIHVHDTDNMFPESLNEIADMLHEKKEESIFNKTGFWFVLEFESHVMLYLNFLTVKHRHIFLDSFLGARGQR